MVWIAMLQRQLARAIMVLVALQALSVVPWETPVV